MIIIDGLDRSAGIARLEVNESFITVPIELIPENAKEGYMLNITATPVEESREQHIESLASKLFKKKS